MLAPAAARFQTIATGLGVEVTIAEFPEGTRTAVDAAAAIGCAVDAIVKSLVFVADDRPVLVLMSGGNRVDEARLATTLCASSVRKATADEVRATTGYAIGGTPPFGHAGGGVSEVLLDHALLEHKTVWAAAGTPSTVFALSPTRLVEASGARVVDVMEASR